MSAQNFAESLKSLKLDVIKNAVRRSLPKNTWSGRTFRRKDALIMACCSLPETHITRRKLMEEIERREREESVRRAELQESYARRTAHSVKLPLGAYSEVDFMSIPSEEQVSVENGICLQVK